MEKIDMKNKCKIITKEKITESVMSFFVITASICIMEGIIGVIFMPEEQFGYKAFFAPPIFALFSVLFGIVTVSPKEMSMKQAIVRKSIHLFLIEFLVFGLNYLSGKVFSLIINIWLAIGIAVIFVFVYVILYLNDRRIAVLFNQELIKFKQKNAGQMIRQDK